MNSIPQTSPQLNHHFPATLRLFGWWDAVIVSILIAASIATIPLMRSLKPDKLLIFRENRIIATYPLDVDRTVTVEGAIGPVELQIKNHSVAITASTCPQHICQRSGAIRRPSAQIICAPNHILVTITSSKKDSVDAVVR